MSISTKDSIIEMASPNGSATWKTCSKYSTRESLSSADGITEAFNARGEMLGIEGLQEIVRQSSSLPADQMKQAVLDGVASWRQGPPTDDVSLMLVHIH